MSKKTNKATNAGVSAITGFALQRNTALYLILNEYESKYKNANYFVCLEHHDDCLICFLDQDNSIITIDAYQSKKKSSDSWTLTSDLLEIFEKILCTGKSLIEDNTYPKSQDYSHSLFFVTNQTVKLKKERDSIIINECKDHINYNELPKSIKECIKSAITDSSLHEQLDKLNVLWIDLSRKADNQEDQLVGKIERIFGDKIESAKAALKLILELFRKIEATYNNGNVASLIDSTKRVSSEDINKAFSIITTKNKCFNYWREQKTKICRLLKIPIQEQDTFRFNFESAFDYFKTDENTEHQLIKKFVFDNFNNIRDAYDEIEMVDKLISLFVSSRTTNLDNLQLKAVFFAAYFEVYKLKQNNGNENCNKI